jgi:peptidoglycan hydrolase CwlO-like protein
MTSRSLKKQSPVSTSTKQNLSTSHSLVQQIESLLSLQQKQHQEVVKLKEEIEGLRRDLSITMESLAELPFVSGVLH